MLLEITSNSDLLISIRDGDRKTHEVGATLSSPKLQSSNNIW
jgi:hypothetical protein